MCLQIASYGHFARIWTDEDDLHHIICRNYLPFAKCDVCVRQRSKDGLRRTQQERDLDCKLTADHLEAVAKEKACYYQHRSKARRTPTEYMSMIIDGADQSKYDLPYWCERSHASDETTRLKMHLYGVLVHGRGAYVFTSPDHEEQGHNTTIQCIWEVIVDQYVKNGNKLPPVLFLQLDNTTKQNKGRFVFAFLSLLVEHGVFERIYVCFLPVGHTHEDIDQMFSRFAMKLRGTNMLSRIRMGEVLRAAYWFEGQPVVVRHWETIANLRDWLKPYIGIPAGIMQFRHFRIGRSEARKVMVQVRLKMCMDMEEDWRGIAANTHRTFLFTTAFGIPDLWTAVEDDAIPDAILRDTTAEVIGTMRKGLLKLEATLPTFFGPDRRDCEHIVDLFEGPAQKFGWDRAAISAHLGKGGGLSAAGVSVAEQELKVTRQLGQNGAQIAKFYMVRPSVPWTGT